MQYIGRLSPEAIKQFYETEGLVIEDKDYIVIRKLEKIRNFMVLYEVPELDALFYGSSFVYMKPIYKPKYKNFVDKLMELT